jgi:hypothetical protein
MSICHQDNPAQAYREDGFLKNRAPVFEMTWGEVRHSPFVLMNCDFVPFHFESIAFDSDFIPMNLESVGMDLHFQA